MKKNFKIDTEIAKVDTNLGLVMGWAIICKQDGQDYFDLQEDHIPEESMLKAATDFMLSSRAIKDMHRGEPLEGAVVFSFPLTTEIAKAFDIESNKTGLMIAMKPGNDGILEKFRSGEYTGFSIGGSRITEEVV